MKNYLILIPLLALPLTSCANMSRNSAYAQDKTVTLDEWEQWAEEITSEVVQGLNQCPPDLRDKTTGRFTLAIGDFTNNTTRMDVAQDKDVFLAKLQGKIQNSGLASVTRLYSGTGGRTDTVTGLSKELVDDPQFDSESTADLMGKASAGRVVLSMALNQKRSVNNSGNDVYENYFQIELIDQVRKTSIYSALVRKRVEEKRFQGPSSR